MVARYVTILTVVVTVVASVAPVRAQMTAAFDDGQPKNQSEGMRDPPPTQIARQAMDLIHQRATVLQLTLPPLALRDDPRSRFFEADIPLESALPVENQDWRSHLTTAEDGAVEMDLPTAFRLAMIHSDAYRRQVESLILAAVHALGTKRGTAKGSLTLKGGTPGRDSVDAQIRSFCSFRRQLLATVACGDTRSLLNSRTVCPPPEFGTTGNEP